MAGGPPKPRMTVSTTDRAKAGEDSSFSADNHSHATISISRDCVEQLNTAEGPSPFELAPSETPSNDSRRGQTHISGTRHTEACPRRSGPGLRTPRRALLTAKRPELQPWIASTRWRRAATTSASNAPERNSRHGHENPRQRGHRVHPNRSGQAVITGSKTCPFHLPGHPVPIAHLAVLPTPRGGYLG